ncbi:MAG: glycosyltransferase family 4 protein [Baekduia sp.]
MRILLVTQMWPSGADPDFGAFLVPQVDELRALGHEVDVVAIDRRGGSAGVKYTRLGLRALRRARKIRPDVVIAHMLFPAGAAALVAAQSVKAPLVVVCHGQDVENLDGMQIRTVSGLVARDAAAVVTNSDWLGERLREWLPGTETTTISPGVDLRAFDRSRIQRVADWPGDSPRLLCVGSLSERKNVVPLADAFELLGRGSLVFVGDGELREQLAGRPGVTLAGRIPHDHVARWAARCDLLCQPSVREPFGIAALEAMALGKPVLVSAEGGAAEFVPADAGVVIYPSSAAAIAAGIEAALALPDPAAAARRAAEQHSAAAEAARLAGLCQAVTASGEAVTP